MLRKLFLNNSFDAALINIDTSLGERIKKLIRIFFHFLRSKKMLTSFLIKKTFCFITMILMI